MEVAVPVKYTPPIPPNSEFLHTPWEAEANLIPPPPDPDSSEAALLRRAAAGEEKGRPRCLPVSLTDQRDLAHLMQAALHSAGNEAVWGWLLDPRCEHRVPAQRGVSNNRPASALSIITTVFAVDDTLAEGQIKQAILRQALVERPESPGDAAWPDARVCTPPIWPCAARRM
jgi:hypothetical protein